MAETRLFAQMLREYLPNEILREELLNRDYWLNMIPRNDEGWYGTFTVPFMAAGSPTVVIEEPPTPLTEAAQQFENALDLALGTL